MSRMNPYWIFLAKPSKIPRFTVFGCGHSKYKIWENRHECMLIGRQVD